jgi:beta-glucosidase
MHKPLRSSALASLAVALTLPAFAALRGPAAKPLSDWPHVTSAFKKDAAIEARVAEILGKMTLAQKIGQMTQPEIKSVTPDDVRQYYLGSVLNGGGSWPNNDKHAKAADWLAMANAFYDASMATDMAIKVPVVWGTDAVHGHNNVYGATMFPHNIGLGAARDPQAGRRDRRRHREGRARHRHRLGVRPDPGRRARRPLGPHLRKLFRRPDAGAQLCRRLREGHAGSFRQDANTIATAKHFMGDGGTDQGKDRGVNKSSEADMMNIHAQGYYTALAAGAQTVMASFNSWDDVAAGKNYGKVHGSRGMLTDILKQKMGFDGFVVTDWNGNGEVPGCTAASCAQAINAGVDMVMVTDEWKAFIKNTMADVEAGRIPMARIDDAVTRILRVKLRAGLFGKRPSQNAYAGKDAALQARELARRAVRESLVLLKNEGPALPLAAGKKSSWSARPPTAWPTRPAAGR